MTVLFWIYLVRENTIITENGGALLFLLKKTMKPLEIQLNKNKEECQT